MRKFYLKKSSIEFLMQGSEAEPYKIIFKFAGSNLTAHCSCPAGKNGLHCKHRLNILMGKTEGIVSGNENDIKIIQSWLPDTDVDVALKDFIEAEHCFESAKKKLSTSKKKLAQALTD